MARDHGAGAFALMFFGLGLGFCYTLLSAKLGIAFAIPVGIVGAVSTMIVLRGPVGRALALRLGLREGEQLTDETISRLLGELDEVRVRMQELEERVDFSERLLASQPREPSR
jgi:hypothetical protein